MGGVTRVCWVSIYPRTTPGTHTPFHSKVRVPLQVRICGSKGTPLDSDSPHWWLLIVSTVSQLTGDDTVVTAGWITRQSTCCTGPVSSLLASLPDHKLA
jgi:hypothetical protein